MGDRGCFPELYTQIPKSLVTLAAAGRSRSLGHHPRKRAKDSLFLPLWFP